MVSAQKPCFMLDYSVHFVVFVGDLEMGGFKHVYCAALMRSSFLVGWNYTALQETGGVGGGQ